MSPPPPYSSGKPNPVWPVAAISLHDLEDPLAEVVAGHRPLRRRGSPACSARLLARPGARTSAYFPSRSRGQGGDVERRRGRPWRHVSTLYRGRAVSAVRPVTPRSRRPLTAGRRSPGTTRRSSCSGRSRRCAGPRGSCPPPRCERDVVDAAGPPVRAPEQQVAGAGVGRPGSGCPRRTARRSSAAATARPAAQARMVRPEQSHELGPVAPHR